jgi:hypothetical protein
VTVGVGVKVGVGVSVTTAAGTVFGAGGWFAVVPRKVNPTMSPPATTTDAPVATIPLMFMVWTVRPFPSAG